MYPTVPRLLAGSPICLAASFLASFFVRFREGLPGIPLGVPRSAGILFCVTFCNFVTFGSSPFLCHFSQHSTSGAPDLSAIRSFFRAHFRAFCAIRQQAGSFFNPNFLELSEVRAAVLFLCYFLQGFAIFQITGPLPSLTCPLVGTLRRVLLPVILLIACCPGSDIPRLRPSYIGGNLRFSEVLACCQPVISTDQVRACCRSALFGCVGFVGMNSSSLLRPAVGYGKIEKRKARDARLTRKCFD